MIIKHQLNECIIDLMVSSLAKTLDCDPKKNYKNGRLARRNLLICNRRCQLRNKVNVFPIFKVLNIKKEVKLLLVSFTVQCEPRLKTSPSHTT